MPKIKIVQIAFTSADDDIYAEYLDDKGRVWYWNQKDKEYKQTDLPDEPKEEK